MKRYPTSVNGQAHVHHRVTFTVSTNVPFISAKAIEAELQARLEKQPYSSRTFVSVVDAAENTGFQRLYCIRIPYCPNFNQDPELPISVVMEHLAAIEKQVLKAQNIRRLATLAE